MTRSLAWFSLLAVACGPATPQRKTIIMDEEIVTAPPAAAADAGAVAEAPRKRAFDYPLARKGDTVDDYHGEKVADPYRWMEDLDGAELAEWVAAQNRLTRSYIDAVPERAAIKSRLTALWDYERYGVPTLAGKRAFYQKNDGLQNQAVLYVADGVDGEPRVLIDPNQWSADGTVALSGFYPSRDGKLCAYSLASAGSDWNEIKVIDVASGKPLEDRLQWIKFSGAEWTPDGKGFYYGRYDEPKPGEALEQANFYQKLYYHRIGTPQHEDVLVHEDKTQPKWGFGPTVSDDGRWLVITVWAGTGRKNQVYVRDLKAKGGAAGQGNGKTLELVTGFEHEMVFIGNVGAKMFFKTDLGAPRGRIVAIDVGKVKQPGGGLAQVVEVVPESQEVIDGASMVGGRIVVETLRDATSAVRVYQPSGKLVGEVAMPGLGSAMGFGGRAGDKQTFFSFTSYTVPESIYRYDLKSGKVTPWRAPKLGFDPAAFESRQVFFQSKDGTRVPMIVVAKKGVAQRGDNPTILYGYGGFKISMVPRFSPAVLVWLEMGGVWAVANLRGGGEYGEEWHQAGTRLNKQNVFDDFIAAAEWLVREKWTNPARLAISGGSNGGLLVGAAMTQRPELFGAALPNVGVMDMLRFHKFTIGWAWVDDYGSADDAEEFKALYAYSPYHNLREGTAYPATLVTTADHDDRVVPSHSFKFAARLQEVQAGDAPALIRVDVRAGHGAGKPTAKLIDYYSDVYAFLVRALAFEPGL